MCITNMLTTLEATSNYVSDTSHLELHTFQSSNLQSSCKYLQPARAILHDKYCKPQLLYHDVPLANTQVIYAHTKIHNCTNLFWYLYINKLVVCNIVGHGAVSFHQRVTVVLLNLFLPFPSRSLLIFRPLAGQKQKSTATDNKIVIELHYLSSTSRFSDWKQPESKQ